jgi:hypothetical protein
MRGAEARQQAQAERLTLRVADSRTGYVRREPRALQAQAVSGASM